MICVKVILIGLLFIIFASRESRGEPDPEPVAYSQGGDYSDLYFDDGLSSGGSQCKTRKLNHFLFCYIFF